VGYHVASSSNNTVTVTGTGSVWANNGELDLGGSGKNNRMTISGGGAVHDTTGYLGLGSSNNVVTITDPGSVWSNGAMVVGESFPGNQMTITNGGAVYSGMLIIGNASTLSTNGNVVTVTGAGSVLNVIPNNLEVGNGTVGNHMTISDGGAVHGPDGFVGFAGKNNVVTVTGTGSVWSTVNLYIGNSSSSNTLIVGPGGSVVATNVYINYLVNAAANRINIEGGSLISTNVNVGNLTCASAAQLTVDTGELIVTNAAHNAALEVLSGTLTLNGGTTVVDRLVITNACARFVHAGGTLIVGSYVFDTNEFRSTAVAPSSNDVLLTWMMGPGATNALQAAPGNPSGGFATNAFIDIFVVTNNSAAGTVTNYLDVGAGTNKPARYYRVRLVP
jgi:T5SS/PEP-CTERM-associated repeat protein